MNKAMSWMMVTLAMLGLFGGRALAGQTNSPGATNDTLSMMWTLNDIYNVLDTRTTNVTKHASFKEPDAGPAPTMHTLNDIMALVTNRVPVRKSGAISQATYDDGWYATNGIGVVLYDPSTRFKTNGDGTVTDKETGLMWLQEANHIKTDYPSFDADGTVNDGAVFWLHAMDFIAGMNAGTYSNCGHTDWRLPNWNELLSLVDEGHSNPCLPTGHPFLHVYAGAFNYWSSTCTTAGNAYEVSMNNGTPIGKVWGSTGACVWPVRGGGQ